MKPEQSVHAYTLAEIKGDAFETKCPFCHKALKARIDRRLDLVTYRAKCAHLEWPESVRSDPKMMAVRFCRAMPAHVARITENQYGTATALGRA